MVSVFCKGNNKLMLVWKLRKMLKSLSEDLLQLLSPYLCFISFLYLDLCVLGDDALIS